MPTTTSQRLFLMIDSVYLVRVDKTVQCCVLLYFIHDSKKSKWEFFYLKRKITLYTMYLPEFKTIHYVILFTRRFEKINKIT